MLFKKMILCNIPLCLVRLLLYWYKNQMLCIKWGSHFSEFFGDSNGVRQGGVLSPYLFALPSTGVTMKGFREFSSVLS